MRYTSIFEDIGQKSRSTFDFKLNKLYKLWRGTVYGRRRGEHELGMIKRSIGGEGKKIEESRTNRFKNISNTHEKQNYFAHRNNKTGSAKAKQTEWIVISGGSHPVYEFVCIWCDCWCCFCCCFSSFVQYLPISCGEECEIIVGCDRKKTTRRHRCSHGCQVKIYSTNGNAI